MRGFGSVLVLAGVAVLTLLYAGRVHASADDKGEITAVEQRAIEGFKAKDVDKIMSCYVPDETLFVFDVVPPREYVGAKAYRKDWEELLAQFPGPAEADMSNLKAFVLGTMGYAHLIVHSVLTDKDGKKTESNVRTTDVFRKTGGKWLTHAAIHVDRRHPTCFKALQERREDIRHGSRATRLWAGAGPYPASDCEGQRYRSRRCGGIRWTHCLGRRLWMGQSRDGRESNAAYSFQPGVHHQIVHGHHGYDTGCGGESLSGRARKQTPFEK